MKITLSKILSEFKESGILTELRGADTEIFNISPVEKCGTGDLVFIDRKDFVELAIERNPGAIVLTDEIDKQYFVESSIPRLITPSVNLALALIRQKYADRDVRNEDWAGISPNAVIHKSANIANDVIIGPNCVIGSDVIIESGVVLLSSIVVEFGTNIGEGTTIHPNVTIGYNTEIGKNVIIKSGTVIGSEGFGFAQDSKRTSYRVPQTGRVVIEDDVVIGANCAIDRATFDITKIGRGTKMDNLCHIAHNVIIGEDCLLTAGLVVAGSTKIGNRVITSGQTGILDHLNIADDTVFLHRAGVTDHVTEPGAYAGLPLQPLQKYLKNMVIMRKLAELRKTIKDIEKKNEK